MFLARSLTRRLAQYSSTIYNYSTNMAQADSINFDEIRSGLENKSLMYLDVRNKSEHESDGTIVGSVNLPLPEIIEAFAETDSDFKTKYGFDKPNKSSGTIVVGCLAGKRAAAAQEQLKTLGFSNVRVYPGSFNDWRANGGPITKK